MYDFEQNNKVFTMLSDFVKARASLHIVHGPLNGMPQTMEDVTENQYASLMESFKRAGVDVTAEFHKYEMIRNAVGVGKIVFHAINSASLAVAMPR